MIIYVSLLFQNACSSKTVETLWKCQLLLLSGFQSAYTCLFLFFVTCFHQWQSFWPAILYSNSPVHTLAVVQTLTAFESSALESSVFHSLAFELTFSKLALKSSGSQSTLYSLIILTSHDTEAECQDWFTKESGNSIWWHNCYWEFSLNSPH